MGQRPKLTNIEGDSERPPFTFSPIGFRFDGRPILPVMGGSGEDDDDDDDDDTSGATVPIARFLKVQQRMKAADRRANTAEARVAELEPVAAKVPDLEKQVEAREATIKTLRIDNAFLTATDVEWQDPEAALRLVDLSAVKIDDDGKVTGLAEALKELAEKRPFLVKPKEEEKPSGKGGDDDEDEEDEDSDEDDTDDQDDDDTGAGGKRVDGKNGQQGGGVSGTSTGSGKRRRKQKGPTDEELMRRYRI